MSAELDALTVASLGGRLYQVEGHRAPHAVTWGKVPTCDCPDFAYRGAQRPCKHIRAVEAFRLADPQAALFYPLKPADVLELLGPSWEDVKQHPERERLRIDPAHRAVAIAGLDAWARELRERMRTPETFDALWIAACSATDGLEMERSDPSGAAEAFATAAAALDSAIVVQQGRAA